MKEKEQDMCPHDADVRQRLETAARKQAERERELTEQAGLKMHEYDQLIDDFDEEARRIASTLTAVDWSRAVIKTFHRPKPHRWSRQQSDEFLCLKLFDISSTLHVWIRSDELPFFGDRYDRLHQPRTYFRRVLDATNMEVQLLDIENQLRKMRSVLRELVNYRSTV